MNQVKLPAWVSIGLLPGLNVAMAFAASALVLLLIGVDPLEAGGLLLQGAFGSQEGIGFTLYYATNFIFTGLAVAVAFHAGLFNIGGEYLNGPSVTLNLSGDFTASAPKGRMIYADGQVMKATRGLVFVQGRIFDIDQDEERVLLSFSGIVKKLKAPRIMN